MQTLTGTKSELEDPKDHQDSHSPDSHFDSSSDSDWLSRTDEMYCEPNLKATQVSPITASMSHKQTGGLAHLCSNATIYRHPVCYTMPNEPHNIPLTGH